MDITFLFKGLLLGFCVAAPVGPVALHCIRVTLHYGRLSGFAAGLGVATADSIYATLSALSMTYVSAFLTKDRIWIHIFGGVFLIVFATIIFFSKQKEKKEVITHTTLLSDYVSTLIFTLANPLTIIAFVAIFAALSISQYEGSIALLILGVFLGSTLWWLILVEGLTYFRSSFNKKTLKMINRIAGIFFYAFAIGALVSI